MVGLMRLSDTLQYTDFLDRLALQQLRGCGWKKGREEGGKDLAEEVGSLGPSTCGQDRRSFFLSP